MGGGRDTIAVCRVGLGGGCEGGREGERLGRRGGEEERGEGIEMNISKQIL